MTSLSYIVWAADPDLFHLGGLTIRWYGLLFALGFLISQQILFYVFRQEGHKEQDVETLTIYMVIATVIGARLGHVLFYEPARYLSNPIDILKIWEGGLASHGAAIGILFALYLYSAYDIRFDLKSFKGIFKKRKRSGQSYLWVVDRIVIVVALTGSLIRFGNFMNSEIVGKPTESSYGVVFARHAQDAIENSTSAIDRVETTKGATTSIRTENQDTAYPVDFTVYFQNNSYDTTQLKSFFDVQVTRLLTAYPSIREDIAQPTDMPLNYQLRQTARETTATLHTFGVPRHPTQLYESVCCIFIFLLLYYLWQRKKAAVPEGQLLGLFLILIFGSRFLLEFLKENQVDWESGLPLNMGQWLSIPLVLVGFLLLFRVGRRTEKAV